MMILFHQAKYKEKTCKTIAFACKPSFYCNNTNDRLADFDASKKSKKTAFRNRKTLLKQ